MPAESASLVRTQRFFKFRPAVFVPGSLAYAKMYTTKKVPCKTLVCQVVSGEAVTPAKPQSLSGFLPAKAAENVRGKIPYQGLVYQE